MGQRDAQSPSAKAACRRLPPAAFAHAAVALKRDKRDDNTYECKTGGEMEYTDGSRT